MCSVSFLIWFFLYFYLNSQLLNVHGFSYASNVRFYGNSYLSNTNSLSPLSLFVMSKLVTVQWFSVEIGLLQYLIENIREQIYILQNTKFLDEYWFLYSTIVIIMQYHMKWYYWNEISNISKFDSNLSSSTRKPYLNSTLDKLWKFLCF